MMFVNSNYFKLLVQNVPHLPSTATPHHEPRAKREGRSAFSCSRFLPRKAHDPGSRKPTAKTWEGLTATFSILKLHLQHGNAWKCQANHAQCHKFTKTYENNHHKTACRYAIPIHFLRQMLDIVGHHPCSAGASDDQLHPR